MKDFTDVHLFYYLFLPTVMGLHRVKDPYSAISATAETCAVAGCNLLKVLKSYIFWIGLTFLSVST